MQRRYWRLALWLWQRPERQRRADFRLAYRVLGGKIIPIIALIGLVWLIVAVLASADTAPPAYLQRELAGYEQKVTARVHELNDALERGALKQAERYLMPSLEQVSELHRFGEALAGGTVIAPRRRRSSPAGMGSGRSTAFQA